MNEQYFSELNGYLVKDAKAREEIENLNDIKMYKFNTAQEMKEFDLKKGDSCMTLGYNNTSDKKGGLYEIVEQVNIFDMDNSLVVNGYYNGSGNLVVRQQNKSFVLIELPEGNVTISSNYNLAKLMGFNSTDYTSGTVLTTNINKEYTYNNDGTYRYFGFYCNTTDYEEEDFYIMINTGTEAREYTPYIKLINPIVLDNSLIANEILNERIDDSFINEDVEITEHICEDSNTYTKYWITKIPRYDKDGNINELKLGFANNEYHNLLEPQTARDFSNLQNATVAINAGVCWQKYHDTVYDGCNMHGLRVLNHEQISNNYEDEWYKKTHYALGITDDGELVSFGTPDENGNVYQSYEESQQLDCKYVTSAFTPIMINGVSQKNILPYTNQWVNNGELVYYQRQVIGQNTTTKDIYIITSNGKGTRLVDGSETQVIDKGLTLDYCISVLQSLGCDFAYQLDEGGSTSLIYKGQLINDVTDSSGKSERELADFLYVNKVILTDKDKEIFNLQKEIGNLKQEINNIKNKLYLNVDSDYTFEIQRWQNGVLNNTLNLRSYGLEYYDNANSKKLFGVDINGLIENQYGKNGKFTASAKRRTDETVFNPFSDIFIYYHGTTDAPYENVNGLCMSFVLWDDNSTNQMIQFVLPHAGDPTTTGLKPRYRTKTYNSTSQEYTWSNWIDIG